MTFPMLTKQRVIPFQSVAGPKMSVHGSQRRVMGAPSWRSAYFRGAVTTQSALSNPAGESTPSLPRRRKDSNYPCFDLSKDEVVQLQLQALMQNNAPYADHGIEVLYRFANFDPFERSHYFGKKLDLGQFERFRRVMHTPCYKTLLDHDHAVVLSSLQVSEFVWKQRLLVQNSKDRKQEVFEFTLVQRFGGRYDGYWFTDSLVKDGVTVQRVMY